MLSRLPRYNAAPFTLVVGEPLPADALLAARARIEEPLFAHIERGAAPPVPLDMVPPDWRERPSSAAARTVYADIAQLVEEALVKTADECRNVEREVFGDDAMEEDGL